MSSQVRRTPVYQIDFTAVLSGKRVASSKRRVRWRFGFANPEALAAGETGTSCRGEEHDITFVWSLTSGKRLVLADGQEVHYSSSRSTLFEYSWTMRGNHVLKVVAHATAPMSPGFKQYDFFVDGQSFFTFPKLFRLGLTNNDTRGTSPGTAQLAESSSRRYRSNDRGRATSEGHIVNIEAPHNPDEEELYLQEAIRQSLNDNGPKQPTEQKAAPQADLLDFGADSSAVPALPPSTAGPPVQSDDPWGGGYSSQPNNELALRDRMSSYSSLPPTHSQSYDTGFGSTPASNPFGVPAAPVNPYAAPSPNPALGTMVPVSSNPYGASPFGAPASIPYNMPADSTPNLYAATPSSTSNPYGAPIASNPYGAPTPGTNPYGAPAQASSFISPPASYPYGTDNSDPATSGYSAPAPISTNLYGSQNIYNDIPPAVTPQAQQTPSTLGFGSPPAEFNFASPGPNYQENTMQNQSERSQQDQTLTMNSLSLQTYEQTNNELSGGVTGGLDQALSKLVNLDSFSLSSKKDEIRSNPFESTTIGGSRSLADIQKNKGPSKKDIMRTPAPPGAMVVSSNQTSSYASQYGIQQPVQQQGTFGAQYGQQQYGAGMQQAQYGAPLVQNQQPQYGQQPPTQQSAPFGQQPPMQQSAPFGQQPPIQQSAPFGQQPPMQQSSPYGQQPPMQSQAPFGQPPTMQSQAVYGQSAPTMQQQPQYGGPPQSFAQGQYGQPPVQQQQTFF